MDLPPSGWYPDPYGVPDLLRWWDGSNWTQHTHPGVGTAGSAGDGAAGGARQTSVQATSVQATTVQPTTVQPAGGGWAARERVIGDWAGTDWPTGDQLAETKPPKGPRTEPQPALPDTAVQPAVQPTAYQPAVTSAAATTVQPSASGGWGATAQPTTVQPSSGWATAGQHSGGQAATAYFGSPAGGSPAGAPTPGGADASGTQVLFLGGDAWQVPGAGGPAQPNRYGYREAQRRRRMWLIAGLVAGTAVAVAVIVVVATSLGSAPGATTADQKQVTPPAPTASTAAPSASAPASLSVSPSASATPPASVLTDGQSGLSYTQLGSPWQQVCPSDLNNAFSWTAGESAVAGQANGGQTTWYGEACSGPLPAQYNYSGVPDLDNTASNVAQTLENAYYNALAHTSSPVLSQPVRISGHPGWELEYLITYTNAAAQGASWTTEEAAVVVVDTGTGNTPVVFFTSIPNTLGVSNVNSLVSSLQLTVVPNASGSPNAGGSPAPGGSPNP